MAKLLAKIRRKKLDDILGGHSLPRFDDGYIQTIRTALEMSSYQLADRMGTSQSAVKHLESSERNGTISLKSLHRVAEALDCEVVYALLPRRSLNTFFENELRAKANELLEQVNHTMALEGQRPNASDAALILDDLIDDLRRKGGREIWSK